MKKAQKHFWSKRSALYEVCLLAVCTKLLSTAAIAFVATLVVCLFCFCFFFCTNTLPQQHRFYFVLFFIYLFLFNFFFNIFFLILDFCFVFTLHIFFYTSLLNPFRQLIQLEKIVHHLVATIATAYRCCLSHVYYYNILLNKFCCRNSPTNCAHI